MDKPPKNTEKPAKKELEIDMDKFRAEMAELIRKACKGEEVVGSLELKRINQNHLKKEDAAVWYKVKNYKPGLFSRADLKTYEEGVMSSHSDSRIIFYGLITQMLTSIYLEEQQREHEKSINGNSNK